MIFLAATITWHKTTGSPASTYEIMYNSGIVASVTSTFSNSAGTLYDGRTIIGVITKAAGVNIATAVLNIDNIVTGASANGNIVAFRIQ